MLRNCADCGKIFSHPTLRYCSSCMKARNDDFGRVKDYLRKNPNASTAETAEATEVDLDTIMGYIRSGRLSIVPRDVQLHCEVCGKTISKGRLCNTCGKELAAPSDESTKAKKSEVKAEPKAKMHILEELRKRH